MTDDLPGGNNQTGEVGIELDTTGWSDDNTIPEGTYRAVLMLVTEAVSRNNNDMLVWEFVLIDPPHAGVELRTWTVKSESSAWKIREMLQATGLGKLGTKMRLVYSEYVNTMVRLVVGKSMFNEQMRNEITRVMAPVEGAGTKLGAGEVPDFEPTPAAGSRIEDQAPGPDTGEEF